MQLRASLPLALLVVAAGCVTAPKPAPVPDFQLQLSPRSYGGELELSQRLTVTRDGKSHSFDAQLEVDAQAVRIAAVAMGQTFASMTWDGTTLQQQVSTHVPAAVTAERILSDVQLAWWPLAAVQAGLPPGWTVEQTGDTRLLSDHGAPVARITYEGNGPAYPHVRLEHVRHGYVLDIDSASN